MQLSRSHRHHPFTQCLNLIRYVQLDCSAKKCFNSTQSQQLTQTTTPALCHRTTSKRILKNVWLLCSITLHKKRVQSDHSQVNICLLNIDLQTLCNRWWHENFHFLSLSLRSVNTLALAQGNTTNFTRREHTSALCANKIYSVRIRNMILDAAGLHSSMCLSKVVSRCTMMHH